MNVKKTKAMVVSRQSNVKVNIRVNGQMLEQVHRFEYLGQWISDDGKCEVDVKCRIEVARNSFVKLRDVLASRQINIDLRKRILRCYVLSTLQYASETWTLNKDLTSRLEAFEMWCYRRMLRLSMWIGSPLRKCLEL